MNPLDRNATNPELLALWKARFIKYPKRHPNIEWAAVAARILANPKGFDILSEMERTGGEPDVIGHGDANGSYLFADCAAETPLGRRSLCYDKVALDARKEAKPVSSAVELASQIGITLLTEAQYRNLQTLGEFDFKTSSWILTPPAIRALDGALFCDRRYDTVFLYHNGASSYYGVRGFRGIVEI
jgi:hypothetical protein